MVGGSPRGSRRAPPPSFVPAPAGVTSIQPKVESLTKDRSTPSDAGGKPSSNISALANGDVSTEVKEKRTEPNHAETGSPSEIGVSHEREGGTLQIGERLKEAVRLCSIGSVFTVGKGGTGAPGALTLNEVELSRPRRLFDAIHVFSCRRDINAKATMDEEDRLRNKSKGRDPTGSGRTAGFLSEALAEAAVDAGGSDELSSADPLIETSWLARRFPKATLGDLLANRLELSLWASYRKRGRPGGDLTYVI